MMAEMCMHYLKLLPTNRKNLLYLVFGYHDNQVYIINTNEKVLCSIQKISGHDIKMDTFIYLLIKVIHFFLKIVTGCN